jgi:hypothetical protein
MRKMIVGIHQPNFFPWIGFFTKILLSDVFVLLDNVQYSPGSWTNRVKILNQKKSSWITCPVIHTGQYQTIREIKIDEKQPWKKNIKKIIKINYLKSDFFSENYEFISTLIDREEQMLSVYNSQNIKAICDILDIKTKFLFQSEFETSKKATELNIEITKKVGGTSYICGVGSRNYQEDQKFSENGIILVHQDFLHPHYPQKTITEFVEGLSVIDVLLNCGIEGTKKIINKSNTVITNQKLALT